MFQKGHAHNISSGHINYESLALIDRPWKVFEPENYTLKLLYLAIN